MKKIDWAPVARLLAQFKAAKDQRTRDLLENAIDREVKAIVRGRPRTGTLETANDNYRRLERNRVRLETLWAPLIPAANDPWPELDRRIDRDRVLDALTPATRRTLDMLMFGFTYAEAAAVLGTPIGTLKSRASRAKRRFGG